MAKAKYKKLTDLYVRGTVKEFDDGTVMWIQVMNPFEADEAKRNAQAVRARIVGALESGISNEIEAMTDNFHLRSRKESIDDILNTNYIKWYQESVDEIQVHEDWSERVEMLKRADNDTSHVSPEEQEYLAQVNREWVIELERRLDEKISYERSICERMSPEDLLKEYRELYLQRRGTEHAIAEFNLNEVYFSTRECNAQKGDEDSSFTVDSHSKCNHSIRVFDSVEEVRDLPVELFQELLSSIGSIGMSARDARFSDRQESSSASSPLPSVVAESTHSIRIEVSESVLGI
jgi:hypothetical protein